MERGGLGLHNFETRIKAARLAWIKRILGTKIGFWISYLQNIFQKNNLLEIFLRRKRMNLVGIPSFYKDIILELQKLYQDKPDSSMSCRNEPLRDNRFIHLRTLNRLQCIWKAKHIYRINDVLQYGRPMTSNEFYVKYDIVVDKQLLSTPI